jgi:hypothetical protein
MDAVPLAPRPADAARCQFHPDAPVLGTCARCGTFFCAQDRASVEGRDYCAACAKRPDVDYLEAFRLKYWGKRDLWAWFVGVGGFLNLTLGLLGFVFGEGDASVRVLQATLVVMGSVGIAFWAGFPKARLAVLLLPVVLIAAESFVVPVPFALVHGILPLLFAIGIFRDTRNRLFFKVEVPREALQKAWHLYANNTVARSGILLSSAGLFIPVFAPFGLVCSLIGLKRVDPHAHPPVGRKGQAIAGIVLGAVALLGWGSVLGFSLLQSRH